MHFQRSEFVPSSYVVVNIMYFVACFVNEKYYEIEEDDHAENLENSFVIFLQVNMLTFDIFNNNVYNRTICEIPAKKERNKM